MYIPKHFQVTDFAEVREFVENHSFGTVVTTDQARPLATHVPLQLRKEGERYFLTGHLAYANAQWKTFGDEEVLVMFQGPHAYVSSSWYAEENVPTWNYQAVHIYGKARLLNEVELEEDLALLLQKYEAHRDQPVLWEKLSSKTKKQIKGIVGFRVDVGGVEAAYKLSQNRGEEDYRYIVDRLKQEGGSARDVAEVMEERRG